jgi:hypothetical protein
MQGESVKVRVLRLAFAACSSKFLTFPTIIHSDQVLVWIGSAHQGSDGGRRSPELVPNGLTHSLTQPSEVYVLRWIAGQTAGIPEFAPMYTIT